VDAVIGSYGAGDRNRLGEGAILQRARGTSPLFLFPLYKLVHSLTDRRIWNQRLP
jgi:hypothetical protein